MNTLAHIFSQPFPTEVNAQAWRAWLAFAFDSAKAAKNLPENPSCRLYEGCEHELGKEEGDEDLRRRIIHDDKAVKIDLQRRVDLTRNPSSRSKAAEISLLEQALSSHEPQDATFLKDIRSSEFTVEYLRSALDAGASATQTQDHPELLKQLREPLRLSEQILRRAQSNSQPYKFRCGLRLQISKAQNEKHFELDRIAKITRALVEYYEQRASQVAQMRPYYG